jgi:hemin uptake protein HemP
LASRNRRPAIAGRREKRADDMNRPNHSDVHYRSQRPLLTMPVRHDVQLPSTRTISSDQLFDGDHEIGIEHRGSFYRLKITRQGKLILNK